MDMTQRIGEVAGQVWECLSDSEERTLASLKKDLNLKAGEAELALGWLAREDKISFSKKGNSTKVSLR